MVAVFRAAAEEQTVALSYVILRPHQHTTLERAASRTGDALTDPEPIQSLHDQFSNLGGYETHVLDSSNMTAEATAESVLEGIARGIYLLDPDDSSTDAGDPIHNS
ncbi:MULTISPECIES: hypothetical protein [Streptomyces]|uniref:Chloramphenicol phosphotransferase-like protein n=1 Tax=Streptomyces sp. 900129855 TaxID=3155129 RepID=A0ABV2ZR53_9ACTN